MRATSLMIRAVVIALAALMAYPFSANASVVTRYHDEALFDDGYIISDVTITQTPYRNDMYTYVVRSTDYWAYYYGGPFDGPTTGVRKEVFVYRFSGSFNEERSMRRYRDVITVGDMECVVRWHVIWNGETLVLENYDVSCS